MTVSPLFIHSLLFFCKISFQQNKLFERNKLSILSTLRIQCITINSDEYTGLVLLRGIIPNELDKLRVFVYASSLNWPE